MAKSTLASFTCPICDSKVKVFTKFWKCTRSDCIYKEVRNDSDEIHVPLMYYWGMDRADYNGITHSKVISEVFNEVAKPPKIGKTKRRYRKKQ